MKLRPLSREDARAIDKRCAKLGLPTLVLMENAGRGAADLLRREISPSARIVFVCGIGNNGGDGAVMARHLDAAGYSTRMEWLMNSEGFWSSGDTSIQNDILMDASRVVYEKADNHHYGPWLDALFAEADWIVDGVFGTGLNRPVKDFPLAAIVAMNRSGKPILALDIPSGLDADTGEPLGAAVMATITATFVAPKLGFSNPEAVDYLGRVEVVEIGAPWKVLEPFAS
jgi:NAD(P)H-hydrate epimerase